MSSESSAPTPVLSGPPLTSNVAQKVDERPDVIKLILEKHDASGPSSEIKYVEPIYDLACPYSGCEAKLEYNRKALENHVCQHRGPKIDLVDHEENFSVGCFICHAVLDDREELRAHLIQHSEQDHPDMGKDIERLAKLYDRSLPDMYNEGANYLDRCISPRVTPGQIAQATKDLSRELAKVEAEYHANPKEEINDIVQQHKALIYKHYDMMSVFRLNHHPDMDARRVRRKALGFVCNIFDEAVLPNLELLRVEHDDAEEHFKSVMAFSQSIMNTFAEEFPQCRDDMAEQLRRLELYKQLHGVSADWDPANKWESHL